MALDYVLRNCTIFVDGRGKAGSSEAITLPKYATINQEHRGGGMAGSIDLEMGYSIEPLSFTLADCDPDTLKLAGVLPGNAVSFTVRGHLHGENGRETAAVVHVRAVIGEIDFGDWKPGEKAMLTIKTNKPRYYEFTLGDQTLWKLDPLAGVYEVGGSDRFASIRRSLGLQFT